MVSAAPRKRRRSRSGTQDQPAAGAQRLAAGSEQLERVVAAGVAVGQREDLGGPGDVEVLNVVEGDERDASHAAIIRHAALGGKDTYRTISATRLGAHAAG